MVDLSVCCSSSEHRLVFNYLDEFRKVPDSQHIVALCCLIAVDPGLSDKTKCSLLLSFFSSFSEVIISHV